ncbi:MAG: cystathionine beta-synthase [Anaerolineales bacterium]|nr:cystathionine beta-synthase [Anaerolineales bacterium]
MTPQGLPESKELRVYNSIMGAIGNTPLVRLSKLARQLPVPLYAKVEFINPGGSVKDRIGVTIIDSAEQQGLLKPGGTVVEATSGNTGVGLAIVCAIRGYKSVFVMPDKMSQEKIQLLRAFGAKVVITPTAVAPEDPRSYYRVAERLAKETPNAILANQYHNPDNPRSHYETTGPEIWEQTGGKVTDVIIGMGTGGTYSGVGKYLKEQNPKVRIVGVDVEGSILKEIWENHGQIPEGVEAITYKVEGIGEDFLPSTSDLSQLDAIVRVNDKESFTWARRLVAEEGIFAGGSAGSALAGAMRYCAGLEAGSLAVVLLPDSGSRYLSKFFDDKWMRENGFLESEWSEASLREALAAKNISQLIAASAQDTISAVVAQMKDYGISQLPVLNAEEDVAGLVREGDLLTFLLDGKNERPGEQPIESLLQPAPPSLSAEMVLGDAMSELLAHGAILVTDGGKPIGILTKIDVLDFIQR